MEVFKGKECEVSRLTYRGAHGISSFMIAPDGTQPNTANESLILKARQQYVNWLTKHAGLFDFIAVEIPCKKPVTDFPAGREPYARLEEEDKVIVNTIVATLNRVFDPDPAIVAEESLDLSLPVELDLDVKDYAEVLKELDAAFSITLDGHYHGKSVPFETVRDLLHLVHLASDPAPSSPRRRRRA